MPLITFKEWFFSKKPKKPVAQQAVPVRGGSQAVANNQAAGQTVDPDELDDLWQANHMGITPKQRVAANANNAQISDERLKAAQDIFNRPQSRD